MSAHFQRNSALKLQMYHDVDPLQVDALRAYDTSEIKSSSDWSDFQGFLVLPQPGVILVQHVIFRFHLWHENNKKYIRFSWNLKRKTTQSLSNGRPSPVSTRQHRRSCRSRCHICQSRAARWGNATVCSDIHLSEDKRNTVSLAVDESSLILSRCMHLSHHRFHLMMRRDAVGAILVTPWDLTMN